MKIIVDNQIVKILKHNASELLKNPFLSNRDNHISFGWPSLLEYLDLGSLLSELPPFDQNQPIFKACVSSLCENEEKEVIFYIYDRLFAENLNQIKDLPQIDASFLLQAIKKQREKSFFLELEKIVSHTLAAYEIALLDKTSDTMHDLILYLAWDRMCVWMAHLFNYQSTNPKFINGIQVLKECLIESYQHIAMQGRTVPGLYRMLESLFFYQMREENLQKHTDAEWALLSQSFPVLKPQNELVDFFYIDDSVEGNTAYLTMDFEDSVHLRLALAHHMIDKIKEETPHWNYTLQPKNILFLNPESHALK